MDTVDVLFPFHKIDTFLLNAISSLRESTRVQVRTIVIDDRPIGAPQIDYEIFSQLNFDVVRTEGLTGYGNALRLGSALVRSEYVALMNSDDLISPIRFFRQIESLSASALSMTGIENISSSGRPLRPMTGGLGTSEYDPLFLALGSYGANATWCAKSSWWIRNAFFDSYSALDWRIALKTFRNTDISFIPENLYFYRKHPGQVTRNSGAMKDIDILESTWLSFLEGYGIVNVGRDSFNLLATSFQNSEISNWDEIEGMFSQIKLLSKNMSVPTAKDFNTLIQRRLALSLRNPKNLQNMPNSLKAKAFRALPSLAADMVINRFS